MRTILIFNDDSKEAMHAAEFVMAMAQELRANIFLANTLVKEIKPVEKIPAGFIEKIETYEPLLPTVFEYLMSLNTNRVVFKPEIMEIDISAFDETKVAELINKNNIWMFVKGFPDVSSKAKTKNKLNIQTILNKVLCPLMLIPVTWILKDLERLVYIADLRYCRIQIVKYLTELAKPLNADLLIAHSTAEGLPDMTEKYALSVFSDEVSRNVSYENLYFNNIRERDLKIAIDVIINGMRNDLLVLVNHRFHFEEIVGRYITDKLPIQITIPLLIFPY